MSNRSDQPGLPEGMGAVSGPAAKCADLVAFLNARLDEVATAIEAAINYQLERLAADGCKMTREELLTPKPPLYEPTFPREIREVEAKRAMVAKYELGRRLWNSDTEAWFSPAAAMFGSDMEWLIRTLAAIWSDHADYRPEWAPER